jgi:hypothetical protein
LSQSMPLAMMHSQRTWMTGKLNLADNAVFASATAGIAWITVNIATSTRADTSKFRYQH